MNTRIEAIKIAAKAAGVRDVFTDGDAPAILQECKDVEPHLLDEHFARLRKFNPSLFDAVNHSAMSASDKSEFISRHGLDAFLNLRKTAQRAASEQSILNWTVEQKCAFIDAHGHEVYAEKVREARRQA